jgi:hypothetical protein
MHPSLARQLSLCRSFSNECKHVLFREGERTRLPVFALGLEQPATQEREFLYRDGMLLKKRQIGCDSEQSPGSIGSDTLERIFANRILLIETGKDKIHISPPQLCLNGRNSACEGVKKRDP